MCALEFCRICLDSNVRMQQISGSEVQDVFELITNIKVQEESLNFACYLCYWQLKKCQQLVIKSQKSEELLKQVLVNGSKLNKEFIGLLDGQACSLHNTMVVSKVEFLQIEGTNVITESDIKLEEVIVKEEPMDEDITEPLPYIEAEHCLTTQLLNENDVSGVLSSKLLNENNVSGVLSSKIFNENDASDVLSSKLFQKNDASGVLSSKLFNGSDVSGVLSSKLFHENDHTSDVIKGEVSDAATDSEDDLPLKSVSQKLSQEDTTKKKKDRNSKDTVDAQEVLLTEKQQIAALIERSKSQYYIRSPFKCEMCFKGFYVSKAYDNHMTRHDERSGQYVCDICKLRYKSAYLLRCHKATSHARLYKCNKCGHTSHTTAQASNHEKWHNGHKYDCDDCGRKFGNPWTLISHKRKLHESTHCCAICGDSFAASRGLILHKSIAHKWDVPPVQEEPRSKCFCVECNVQFLTVDAWQRHILTSVKHLTKKDGSQCKICHETIKDDMSKHLKEHKKSLQKAFACEHCDTILTSKNSLRGHMRKVHFRNKAHKKVSCNDCGRKFRSETNLKLHQLREHAGVNPFPCDMCDKRYPNKYQYVMHRMTHTGERPYSCDVCGKGFIYKTALDIHNRTHTGEKPYECQICLKRFSQPSSIKFHKRQNTCGFKRTTKQ